MLKCSRTIITGKIFKVEWAKKERKKERQCTNIKVEAAWNLMWHYIQMPFATKSSGSMNEIKFDLCYHGNLVRIQMHFAQ
jgi:hypothetical protein